MERTFVMADTPSFPDANPVILSTRQKQLQLIWSMIPRQRLAHVRLKNRVSIDYQRRNQAPVWKIGEPIFFDLKDSAAQFIKASEHTPRQPEPCELRADCSAQKNPPTINSSVRWGGLPLPSINPPTGRMLLPLYSSALSISMMALSDNGAKSWLSGKPIVGIGNIQPTVVRKNDGKIGRLYAQRRFGVEASSNE
jgi:hypothetical protein